MKIFGVCSGRFGVLRAAFCAVLLFAFAGCSEEEIPPFEKDFVTSDFENLDDFFKVAEERDMRFAKSLASLVASDPELSAAGGKGGRFLLVLQGRGNGNFDLSTFELCRAVPFDGEEFKGECALKSCDVSVSGRLFERDGKAFYTFKSRVSSEGGFFGGAVSEFRHDGEKSGAGLPVFWMYGDFIPLFSNNIKREDGRGITVAAMLYVPGRL